MKKDILNRSHFHWSFISTHRHLNIFFNWRPSVFKMAYSLSFSKDYIEITIGIWFSCTISLIF